MDLRERLAWMFRTHDVSDEMKRRLLEDAPPEIKQMLRGTMRPDPNPDPNRNLPPLADQLAVIRKKIDVEKIGHRTPFSVGDVVTQRKDADEYRFPVHGAAGVVVATNIPHVYPKDGSPVRHRCDMSIVCIVNGEPLEYQVHSRFFEPLDVPKTDPGKTDRPEAEAEAEGKRG